MDVQVEYRLSDGTPVVDHQAEVRQLLFGSHLARHEEEVAGQLRVLLLHVGHLGDGHFRDHEDVDGCLGVDVAERQSPVIFVDNVGGDLAVDDFLKDGANDCLPPSVR